VRQTRYSNFVTTVVRVCNISTKVPCEFRNIYDLSSQK